MFQSTCWSLTLCLMSHLLFQNRAQLTDSNNGTVDLWTRWSPCSKTCGPGISTRHCQNDPTREPGVIISKTNVATCNGTTEQVKLCNLKGCPGDQPTLRQTSCSLYNSRKFSGRQYVWEPFIHPTDPCKLACRAKGEHFYANLPDKVENGTPCKLGARHAVCIKGFCKPVGCDGIVESAATKDVCGVCNGDGSSCQTISGIFTSTDLKPGLNYVISIPAGSTNINVTELRASRNNLVLQTVDGRHLINNDTGSSTSSVVEAAGTIISYEAKSPPHGRESIVAAGPTNVTLVLKILVKGSNPGILYTFSVSRELGDAVIQQIRHRSKPVEIPPEPDYSHHFPDSTSLEDVTSLMTRHIPSKTIINGLVKPHLTKPREQHFLTTTELYKKSDSIRLVQKTIPILDENMSSQKFYETTTTTQSMSTVSETSSSTVHVNHINIKRNGSDISTARNYTTSHGAKTVYTDNRLPNEGENTTHNGHILNRTLQSLTGVGDHVDYRDLIISNKLKEKISHNETTMSSNVIANKGYNDTRMNEVTDNMTEADHPSTYITNLSNLSEDTANSELKSHQNIDGYHSFLPKENDTSDVSVHLTGIPVRGLADSNAVKEWNQRSGKYETSSTRNTSVITISNEIQETSDSEGQRQEHGTNGTAHRYQTAADVNKVVISISHREKTSHKYNVSNADRHRLPVADADHKDVYKTKTANSHLSSVSAADNLRFMVPRYSQIFKFPQKHKHGYNINLGRVSTSRSNLAHHLRHQSHNSNNSIHSPSKASLEHLGGENTTFNIHAGSSLNHVDSQQPNVTFSGSHHLESVTTIHSTPTQINERIRQTVPEGKTNETILLDNYSPTTEERKGRLEEQRNLYNERLRELQERIRQRQAALAISRASSFNFSHTKINNNKTNNNGHKKNTDRTTSKFNTLVLKASKTGNKTASMLSAEQDLPVAHSNTSPDRLEENDHLTYDTGKRLVTASNVSVTGPRPVILQNEVNLENRDYLVHPEEHQTSVLRQTESPRKQHFSQNSHTNVIYNRNANAEDFSSELSTHGRYQENLNVARGDPKAILSRLKETPIALTENRSQSGTSHDIPASEQTRQAHLSAVHSVETLPLTRNEVSIPTSIQQMNRQLSTNQILLNRIAIANSVDSGANSRQAELNTHSFVYEWRVSGLTQCTHSCGGGVQQTVVVCVDTITQAVVTDENCRHFMRPKLFAVPCNTRPCSAEWVPGPWSSCTVSCGVGEQTRTVTCQARVSSTLNMTMPSSSCQGQIDVADKQACSNGPCSSWRVGSWSNVGAEFDFCLESSMSKDQSGLEAYERFRSLTAQKELNLLIVGTDLCEVNMFSYGAFPTCVIDLSCENSTGCSASCGDGHRSRDVQCVGPSDQLLADDVCTELKPQSQEPCTKGDCGKGWFFTEWNQECSSECGSGVVRRNAFCADESGSKLPEDRCDITQRPAVTQPCRASQPCGGVWFIGHWSQCDAKCGPGNRRRQVLCVKEFPVNGFAIVGEDNCTDVDKPVGIEPCQLSPCYSEWYMTSWSQCSQTCGTGSRVREVRCLGSDQKPADDCPLAARPKTRDSCNTHSCSHAVVEENTPDCTDKFSQCSVVKRARLCRYGYYRKTCCRSCSEHIYPTTASDTPSY